MKKLNGLFMLLLILAAVFGMVACEQPTEPEVPPEVTPEPTPSFDVSQYAIPDDVASLTWDDLYDSNFVFDPTFDLNRLKNTEWVGISHYSDTQNGIVTDAYQISIVLINADATDTSITAQGIEIYSKADGTEFTDAEKEALKANVAAYEAMMPGSTVTLKTGSKTAMLELSADMGNTMNGSNPFINVIKSWCSIDTSNTYLRMRMGQDPVTNQVEYMYFVKK